MVVAHRSPIRQFSLFKPFSQSSLPTAPFLFPSSTSTTFYSSKMSRCVEPQPDAWQQNAVFSELLQAPPAKQALASLETDLKPIFNSHALYSLETGQLIVKLHSLTSLLTRANLLPHLTPHDFKLGLHLAITPSLSQSASPSKDQPLHFDTFLNAVAFCAFYYPPLKDPSQTPKPRLHHQPISHFEHMLDTVRERLIATFESPRSMDSKALSPASSMAFVTPYARFPDDSPIDTLSSGMSTSPGGEVWFTPAPSNIRTRLFQFEEVDTPVVPDFDVETENGVARIRSIRKIEPETCSKAPKENDIHGKASFDSTGSKQETSTDRSSSPRSETLSSQPLNEIHSCQNTEELPSTTNGQQTSDTITPRKLAEVSELKESKAQPKICEESEAVSQALSPSTQTKAMSIPQVQISDEPTVNPGVLAEEDHGKSPECPSTDLSLAPSTVLSHLPSPESHFESPHLSCDANILNTASSVEPASSRKLSFSDSESDSSSSSCYEHSCNDQDTMTRIDNALDNSLLVEDFDECDEELDSDMILPHSPSSRTGGGDMVVNQSFREKGEQQCPSKELSRSASNERETETASSFPPRTPTDSSPTKTEASGAILNAANAYNTSGVGNDSSCVFEATQDVNLDEPEIALGLPADAFSEAGGVVLRTPIAKESGTRIDDTDIEYDEEEDYTLLFDDGNESDGSELSMGTRETMRKLVEDHLSSRGTPFSQYYEGGHFYAEDQVMVTPDRESHVAFCDTFMATCNTFGEDGPFRSERPETRRSRVTRLETDQILDSADACNRETRGYVLGMDATEQDANYGILSPVIGSRRGSLSSEISPDGLNLIKKQLVLPHPFVPPGSTVGSSISSAPGTQGEKEVERNEKVENCEDQRIMTISPKKTRPATEKSVAFRQQDLIASTMEVEMVHVMRETLETCRVLREEIAQKQQPTIEPSRRQTDRGFGRIIEFGIFGLVIVFVTLLLVERRIQRSMFVDVLL